MNVWQSVWQAMGNITQAKINKREVPDGVHCVDRGLYLRVRGTSLSWILKIQINGKRKEIALGSAASMPMSVAKARAIKLRVDIASGKVDFDNPRGTREQVSTHKFSDVAAEAIEVTANMKRWKNARVLKHWKQTIRDFVLPIIGDKDVESLGVEDVLDVLVPIWETKTPTAKNVRGRMHRIFEYATHKGWYNKPNPARWSGNLDMVLPSPDKLHSITHLDALTFEDARAVAQKFYASRFLSHKMTLFGMLVPARVSEFRLARWDEIDFEARTFTVPAVRRKTGNEDYVVPLCHQAISILESIERVGEYVFCGKDGRPLTLDTPRQTLLRQVGYHVTMHGMRSTFRDWAVHAGVDDKVAEKILSHVWGNKVTRAYLRTDMLEERRVVMQQWADALLDE